MNNITKYLSISHLVVITYNITMYAHSQPSGAVGFFWLRVGFMSADRKTAQKKKKRRLTKKKDYGKLCYLSLLQGNNECCAPLKENTKQNKGSPQSKPTNQKKKKKILGQQYVK